MFCWAATSRLDYREAPRTLWKLTHHRDERVAMTAVRKIQEAEPSGWVTQLRVWWWERRHKPSLWKDFLD